MAERNGRQRNLPSPNEGGQNDLRTRLLSEQKATSRQSQMKMEKPAAREAPESSVPQKATEAQPRPSADFQSSERPSSPSGSILRTETATTPVAMPDTQVSEDGVRPFDLPPQLELPVPQPWGANFFKE